LELHNEFIRGRGLDPKHLLRQLADLGYRDFQSGKSADLISTADDGPIRVGLAIS
jgi:hypothetical protein